jgi:hypothetical protein
MLSTKTKQLREIKKAPPRTINLFTTRDFPDSPLLKATQKGAIINIRKARNIETADKVSSA